MFNYGHPKSGDGFQKLALSDPQKSDRSKLYR